MEQTLQKINSFFENLPDWLREHRMLVIFFFAITTVFFGFGMKNVVIEQSQEAYFHKDDPVKKAYDNFRRIFGGDEYVYIVYRAKDKDIFSKQSLNVLKNLHNEFANYHLNLDPEKSNALAHIEEVKSLINVKYMEAHDNTLYSRNFIGDRLPQDSRQKETLKQQALNHPDYPQRYLSYNCEYGGIIIRTDFNAETQQLSKETQSAQDTRHGFDSDDEIFFEESEMVVANVDNNMTQGIGASDIREYPLFMNEIRRILENPEYQDHLEFFPVGNPVFMDFFATEVINDMGRLMSLVLLLIVIMLWLLFRSFCAVIWPILIVLFTIVWVLGLVGWVNIPMSAMLQVIIFLALSVGVADSVHILSGYLFFRNQNLDHQKAIRAVMKKSGLACLLTSITTSIGLLSLVLVPLKPISHFGVFASISVIFAFVFTIILLPLMLDIWSPVPKKKTIEKDYFILKLLKKIELIGVSRPYIVVVIFLGAGVLLCIGVTQLKIDTNLVEIFKKGLPIRDAYTIVNDHMGGTGNMEVMLDFKKEDALKNPDVLFAMESLQQFMENDENNRVKTTMSLVNVVKDSFKALNDDKPDKYIIPSDPAVLQQVLFLFESANPKDKKRLVSDDYSKARVGLNSINIGSIEALIFMNSIQAFIDTRFEDLKQEYPDLNITLTGNMALLTIMLDYIAWSQIKSFSLALLVISIILFMVLGSYKAGLVALAPNLFPILTTFGLMGYFKVPLDADTLLIAPIIIGLAVDDTIHFMTHFRIEMGKTKDIKTAVVKSIREAGQAISFTSLILSTGFLVFILSFHNGLSHFGIFAAIAIMTALITDLFLLPALCRISNLNFTDIKG